MKGGTKLFRIFGIDVKIHFSWWFIFILIAWSLATTYFPQEDVLPNATNTIYWVMGIASALLLFVSVLLHELSHSLVAKAKNIEVESITLFFFGGVAGITTEDMKPSSEFQMAIAGPLFSLLLAGLFYLITFITTNPILNAIASYLALINFILAIFNLVPGYPLDGGRAFRAILNAYYKDLVKATKIAATGGRIVALFLIALGLIGLFTGSGGGLWFIFLGGFLYFIAKVSYEQVVVKSVLEKVPIKQMMKKKSALNPEMKFQDFLKKFAKGEEDVFLVESKKFSGILDLKRVKKIPETLQKNLKLKQASLPLHQLNVVQKTDNSYQAFMKLSEQNLDLLPVLDKNKIIGIIKKQSLLHRLTWDLNYSFSKKLISHVRNKKK